ncbi:GTPase HRas-like [Macrotis lagotis]|uniref:GTPase HRas-like n=1 Tax=Macrotis lagotis TaxID=92651 RepID=UPI003D695ACB
MGAGGPRDLRFVGVDRPRISVLLLNSWSCASSPGFFANSQRVGSRGRAEMSYRVVLLGSSGAGKSALTLRFLENRFVEECEPTARDLYQGQLLVDGEPCQLAIMDTSGRELYRDLREDCIRRVRASSWSTRSTS